MPRGPRGERRPAVVIGEAIRVARIATEEEPEASAEDIYAREPPPKKRGSASPIIKPGECAMMIDCDKNMIVHLLRNWRPNRLRPQGFRLAYERPRLITMQKGACPLCSCPLTNDGKVTHIDHVVTVTVFADKVLHGELTFDDAYHRLWEDPNLRATHRGCNYARKNLSNLHKFQN